MTDSGGTDGTGEAESEPRPLPAITPETAPFWEATKAHELRLQHCDSCGSPRFPPSPICPDCWSMESTWKPVSGAGKVFSFVTFRRMYHRAFRNELPYVVAVVALDEGPRMLSRVVGLDDPDELEVGDPVAVQFEEIGGGVVLPCFARARVGEGATAS